MIEDEARTKWCPKVQILITPSDNVWQNNMMTNRGDIPADNSHLCCIASDCMWWVWEEQLAKNKEYGTLVSLEAAKDAIDKNPDNFLIMSKTGHCGAIK